MVKCVDIASGSIQEMLQCYSNNNDLEVYAPIQDHYVVKVMVVVIGIRRE